MLRSMLTTIDNPHDPFEDFDAWYIWDFNSGYHTPSFLARLTFSAESLSESRQAELLEQAIDEVVKENVLGIYKKVTKEVPEVYTT